MYNVLIVVSNTYRQSSGRLTPFPKGVLTTMYTVNSIRNICLLGHSGSGKSALAESLLYMTGAISRLGGRLVGVERYTLSSEEESIERSVVVVEKVSPTPSELPRGYGAMVKKGL